MIIGINAVPDVLPNGVQADATAYFGSIPTNATIGTEIFPFRIIIDPSRYYGDDLDAIITVLNRDNLVAHIFRFSDNTLTRTFTFIGGINAANASGQLPCEIRVLENGLVILEDSVIYNNIIPHDLWLMNPFRLEFDMSVIVVGRGPGARTIQTDFAVGTVDLIPPPPGVYMTYNNIIGINYNHAWPWQLITLPPCPLHVYNVIITHYCHPCRPMCKWSLPEWRYMHL